MTDRLSAIARISSARRRQRSGVVHRWHPTSLDRRSLRTTHGDRFAQLLFRSMMTWEARAARSDVRNEAGSFSWSTLSSGSEGSAERVANPPEHIATFLADGGYLPRGVPLMKRVLALPGQELCRKGLRIIINGLLLGTAAERDTQGRPLPDWQGCRVVLPDQVFLMNWNEPSSLDGRYFGPIPFSSIVGRAQPLWTFEDQ
jgi:type IV secretory pathway protease TraF